MPLCQNLFRFCLKTKILISLISACVFLAMVVSLSFDSGKQKRLYEALEAEIKADKFKVHRLKRIKESVKKFDPCRNLDEKSGLTQLAACGKKGDHSVKNRMRKISNKNRSSSDSKRTGLRKKKPSKTPNLKETQWPDEKQLPHNKLTSHNTSSYLFKTWINKRRLHCNHKFIGFDNLFVRLKDVILDRTLWQGRKGGEEIEEVLNQREEDEYYVSSMGSFQLQCKKRPNYYFLGDQSHLTSWYSNLQTKDVDRNKYDQIQPSFTIAITRYEYANLYHTMTDFYNAFLMMMFFNKSQSNTNILLIDGHPKGALDPVWSVLFNSTKRISSLPNRTLFENMVWGIRGYESPMLVHSSPELPLSEEFRKFFLKSYTVNDNWELHCDNPSVLFIWRRDYLAHPRNPKGLVTRKIKNERELIIGLQKKYPKFHVRGVQIDIFDMRKQLQLVAETDILIGMHGAGLTHSLFLPKHSVILEFYPDYWSPDNHHFKAIAQWRHLRYDTWVNMDPHNESPNHYTRIPPGVLFSLFRNALKNLCNIDTSTDDPRLPNDPTAVSSKSI